jgi:alpha-D-xyloside xylohydrolase
LLIVKKRVNTTVQTICKTDNALILQTENGKIKIEPYSDSIFRIVYTLSDDFSTVQGLGILPNSSICKWSYNEESENITVLTKNIRIVINKQTSTFAYYDKNGKLLTKEPDKGGKTLVKYNAYKTILDEDSVVEKIDTPDGVKEVVLDAKKVFYKSLYHTKLEFEWLEDEALYGLGQQEEGFLNLRGTRQYIHQANLKIAIPVLVSTRGYGLLFDTYSPIIFNDNEYGSYIYNESANEMDFYFIYGESFDNIVSGYRSITGKATMLPKWAFGLIQSQERFETQQEITDTVKEYQRRNIPLDCIVLDWAYWEDGKFGQKSFDLTRFPDAKVMTDTLHENGVHFMISIWPIMNKISENYAEMEKCNFLFQRSEIYDAFNEDAGKLYWKQANEGLFSKGIDAWWCDSSEPFTPEWNTLTKPEPDKNFFQFHDTAKVYIDEEYTSTYALMHAKSIYEGQRSVTSEKRVVNLTRSGYTGQQKYGTILWSGDISAKWETLKRQIPAGLNFCVTGMPYWTLDVGAFFVKKGDSWFWDGEYENGCNDLGYRELYTRMYQYGVFLPVLRSHGTDARREIWNFGEVGEMFYDSISKYTKLRYRLLPYIYSTAAMVTLMDYTIMRLLAFDFVNDSKVFDIKDQYMFGKSIMVCPVTNSMYYDKESKPLENIPKQRKVYLPNGCGWYNFHTNEFLAGGQEIIADADISIIPLFVKAGSIIPLAEVAQSSKESSDNEIELIVYPGADGEFTLYQDEKDNYNYEKGKYSLINIRWNDGEDNLTIGQREGSYAGMPSMITFKVKIEATKNFTVLYDGTEIIYSSKE